MISFMYMVSKNIPKKVIEEYIKIDNTKNINFQKNDDYYREIINFNEGV